MYTAPVSVAYFGDVIEHTNKYGKHVKGKVQRIGYDTFQSGVKYVHLTLDNGTTLYASYKTVITILEMADANNRARTRNWPECWKQLGITKVS